MNELPGITTIGSCGGHENPDKIQHGPGEWFVTFKVAPTRGGWRSLEIIAGLPNNSPHGPEDIKPNGSIKRTLTVDIATSCGGGYASGRSLFFAITTTENGRGKVTPQEIENVLRR